jgi:alcohol dehydrogenase (NADP+)
MEVHPWLQQKNFIHLNNSKGIHVIQYSPFGNQNPTYDEFETGTHKLIEEPILMEIGKAHGKTGAQVALAWGIAHGRSVIPKSKTEERIKQNFDIGFELSKEEVDKIDGMDRKKRFNDSSEDFGYVFFKDLDGKL